MRFFNKSEKLDNVCYDIRGPVMDEANRMSADGLDVLKLNIGNPAPFGFRTPEPIVEEMISHLTDSEGYSDSKGLISAREAIAAYCEKKGFTGVNVDNIYTGNGVSELISIAMNGLINHGDEVLVPAPDYPLWTASVTMAGGKAVHYICDEKAGWNPDIDDILSKVNEHTKGIVLINPNNPTGALYSRDVLERIADIARKHSLMIFADEIYDRLVFDGKKHISIASLAQDIPVVTFNGLSKSHLIAGYRVGWMVISGDKANIKGYIDGVNLLSSMRLCSNVPAQSIIPKAMEMLDTCDDLVAPGSRIYEQREIIYNAICDIPGLSVVKPEAAFYIFPRMDTDKYNITDDEKFALDLLKSKKILVTHGGGFHWSEPDHFRIVFLPEVSVLSECMDRMKEFFADYKQV